MRRKSGCSEPSPYSSWVTAKSEWGLLTAVPTCSVAREKRGNTKKTMSSGSGSEFKSDISWTQANCYWLRNSLSVSSTNCYSLRAKQRRGKMTVPACGCDAVSFTVSRINSCYLGAVSPHCGKIAVGAPAMAARWKDLWISLWCANRLFSLLQPTLIPRPRLRRERTNACCRIPHSSFVPRSPSTGSDSSLESTWNGKQIFVFLLLQLATRFEQPMNILTLITEKPA